ncbi:Hypothetical protein, putative [Bodo saltans]|uniref:Uncharacterized protein n=1 Tax=Bodo saltans TaxID=75058 RepID=A0A0S4IMW8_BODSA|nr:Hypothetical protein, putative [Bodo saltans]|eukprot:CUE75349.1 Hypothetical protein, putative [Bodo saltans]
MPPSSEPPWRRITQSLSKYESDDDNDDEPLPHHVSAHNHHQPTLSVRSALDQFAARVLPLCFSATEMAANAIDACRATLVIQTMDTLKNRHTSEIAMRDGEVLSESMNIPLRPAHAQIIVSQHNAVWITALGDVVNGEQNMRRRGGGNVTGMGVSAFVSVRCGSRGGQRMLTHNNNNRAAVTSSPTLAPPPWRREVVPATTRSRREVEENGVITPADRRRHPFAPQQLWETCESPNIPSAAQHQKNLRRPVVGSGLERYFHHRPTEEDEEECDTNPFFAISMPPLRTTTQEEEEDDKEEESAGVVVTRARDHQRHAIAAGRQRVSGGRAHVAEHRRDNSAGAGTAAPLLPQFELNEHHNRMMMSAPRYPLLSSSSLPPPQDTVVEDTTYGAEDTSSSSFATDALERIRARYRVAQLALASESAAHSPLPLSQEDREDDSSIHVDTRGDDEGDGGSPLIVWSPSDLRKQLKASSPHRAKMFNTSSPRRGQAPSKTAATPSPRGSSSSSRFDHFMSSLEKQTQASRAGTVTTLDNVLRVLRAKQAAIDHKFAIERLSTPKKLSQHAQPVSAAVPFHQTLRRDDSKSQSPLRRADTIVVKRSSAATSRRSSFQESSAASTRSSITEVANQRRSIVRAQQQRQLHRGRESASFHCTSTTTASTAPSSFFSNETLQPPTSTSTS